MRSSNLGSCAAECEILGTGWWEVIEDDEHLVGSFNPIRDAIQEGRC